MARFVRHRINARAQLAELAPGDGAEIDLRSHAAGPTDLYVAHDPWQPGEALAPWLAAWAAAPGRGTLWVNTKEDGLEHRFMAAAAAAGVQDFVFLDTAPPTQVRLLGGGHGDHVAVRLSAYEPLACAEALAAVGQPPPAWIWADCFGGVPLPASLLVAARRLARVCLVSPELQGMGPEALAAFAPLRPHVDAICTKSPEAWREAAAAG